MVGHAVVDAAERSTEGEAPGMVRLRLALDYPDEVPGQLLAIGPNLEVIGPPEIREQVIKLADLVAARYRAVAPVDAGR